MNDASDEENRAYCVLVNGEGQHSLWPQSVKIPDGWTQMFGPSPKADCLDYVNRNWADMRPRSLVESMDASSTA